MEMKMAINHHEHHVIKLLRSKTFRKLRLYFIDNYR